MSEADLAPERRGYIKLSKRIDVWFKVLDGSGKDATRRVFHCHSENMGGGGVYLTSPPVTEIRREKLIAGEFILQMKIHLPGVKNAIRAEGKVMWISDLDDGKVGMGVDFTQLEQEDREKILSYVMGRFHF